MASPAVFCRDLRKYYPDVKAVDGLDLTIDANECFCLLGPNGAGKTTTIEVLEGLTTPDGGEVKVLGLDWNHDERELRERIGISLQETQLAEKLTVYETLRLFRSFYRAGRDPDELLNELSLDEKRNSRVGKPATNVDACGNQTTGATLTFVKATDTITVDGNGFRTETKGTGECK